MSLYERQFTALDKRRQKITVEHVTVQAGGQAIVGEASTEQAAPPSHAAGSQPIARAMGDDSAASGDGEELARALKANQRSLPGRVATSSEEAGRRSSAQPQADDGKRALRGKNNVGKALPLASRAGNGALPDAWRRPGVGGLLLGTRMRSSTGSIRGRQLHGAGHSTRFCAKCVGRCGTLKRRRNSRRDRVPKIHQT